MTAPSSASLEAVIGYAFRNPALMALALTHSSAGASAGASQKGVNYERLEFLGDRVLGLVVARMLYETFPIEPEGDLAKRLAALVQGTMLADIARSMNLGAHIKLSDSERAGGGALKDNLLADSLEALIGAVYLDGGLAPCETFIARLWADKITIMSAPPQHPKTALQEWAQARGMALPVYALASQSGPDHAPVFEIEVSIGSGQSARASGPSRQEAEKRAAQALLAKLEGGV